MASLGKNRGPLRISFIPFSLLQDNAQIKLCFKPKAFNCLDKIEFFFNSVVKKTDSGTNCLSLLTALKVHPELALPSSLRSHLSPGWTVRVLAMWYPHFPITTPSSQCLSSLLAPSVRNMLSSIFLPTSPSRLILASSPYKCFPDQPFGFQAFSCRPTALVSFRTKDYIMFVITIMGPCVRVSHRLLGDKDYMSPI